MFIGNGYYQWLLYSQAEDEGILILVLSVISALRCPWWLLLDRGCSDLFCICLDFFKKTHGYKIQWKLFSLATEMILAYLPKLLIECLVSISDSMMKLLWSRGVGFLKYPVFFWCCGGKRVSHIPDKHLVGCGTTWHHFASILLDFTCQKFTGVLHMVSWCIIL